MKLLIAAAGSAKASPERELFQDYLKRLPWKAELKEIESKQKDPVRRKADESELLLAAAKGYDRIVALDEAGKNLSSREFAAQISDWQQQGSSSFAFIIGGSDGLDASVLKKANLVWSLGRATWPHQLARAMLAEQLYRAWSVMHNHPYHRG